MDKTTRATNPYTSVAIAQQTCAPRVQHDVRQPMNQLDPSIDETREPSLHCNYERPVVVLRHTLERVRACGQPKELRGLRLPSPQSVVRAYPEIAVPVL